MLQPSSSSSDAGQNHHIHYENSSPQPTGGGGSSAGGGSSSMNPTPPPAPLAASVTASFALEESMKAEMLAGLGAGAGSSSSLGAGGGGGGSSSRHRHPSSGQLARNASFTSSLYGGGAAHGAAESIPSLHSQDAAAATSKSLISYSSGGGPLGGGGNRSARATSSSRATHDDDDEDDENQNPEEEDDDDDDGDGVRGQQYHVRGRHGMGTGGGGVSSVSTIPLYQLSGTTPVHSFYLPDFRSNSASYVSSAFPGGGGGGGLPRVPSSMRVERGKMLSVNQYPSTAVVPLHATLPDGHPHISGVGPGGSSTTPITTTFTAGGGAPSFTATDSAVVEDYSRAAAAAAYPGNSFSTLYKGGSVTGGGRGESSVLNNSFPMPPPPTPLGATRLRHTRSFSSLEISSMTHRRPGVPHSRPGNTTTAGSAGVKSGSPTPPLMDSKTRRAINSSEEQPGAAAAAPHHQGSETAKGVHSSHHHRAADEEHIAHHHHHHHATSSSSSSEGKDWDSGGEVSCSSSSRSAEFYYCYAHHPTLGRIIQRKQRKIRHHHRHHHHHHHHHRHHHHPSKRNRNKQPDAGNECYSPTTEGLTRMSSGAGGADESTENDSNSPSTSTTTTSTTSSSSSSEEAGNPECSYEEIIPGLTGFSFIGLTETVEHVFMPTYETEAEIRRQAGDPTAAAAVAAASGGGLAHSLNSQPSPMDAVTTASAGVGGASPSLEASLSTATTAHHHLIAPIPLTLFGTVAPEYPTDPKNDSNILPAALGAAVAANSVEADVPKHDSNRVADSKVIARLRLTEDQSVMLIHQHDEVGRYLLSPSPLEVDEYGENSGACECDEQMITKDYQGGDCSRYDYHQLFRCCVYCKRRPSAFLCIHCLESVCPSHVHRHYLANPTECRLFLNSTEISTSFDHVFWCEPCQRFTWKYTEAFDGLVDHLGHSRGTYNSSPVRDIHCIGYQATLKPKVIEVEGGGANGGGGGGGGDLPSRSINDISTSHSGVFHSPPGEMNHPPTYAGYSNLNLHNNAGNSNLFSLHQPAPHSIGTSPHQTNGMLMPPSPYTPPYERNNPLCFSAGDFGSPSPIHHGASNSDLIGQQLQQQFLSTPDGFASIDTNYCGLPSFQLSGLCRPTPGNLHNGTNHSTPILQSVSPSVPLLSHYHQVQSSHPPAPPSALATAPSKISETVMPVAEEPRVPVGAGVVNLSALGASVRGWRVTQEDAEAAFMVNLSDGFPPDTNLPSACESPKMDSDVSSSVAANFALPEQLPMAVFCVFDGHGGDAVAKLAAIHFESHVRQALASRRTNGAARQSLGELFQRVHCHLQDDATAARHSPPQGVMDSSSAAGDSMPPPLCMGPSSLHTGASSPIPIASRRRSFLQPSPSLNPDPQAFSSPLAHGLVLPPPAVGMDSSSTPRHELGSSTTNFNSKGPLLGGSSTVLLPMTASSLRELTNTGASPRARASGKEEVLLVPLTAKSKREEVAEKGKRSHDLTEEWLQTTVDQIRSGAATATATATATASASVSRTRICDEEQTPPMQSEPSGETNHQHLNSHLQRSDHNLLQPIVDCSSPPAGGCSSGQPSSPASPSGSPHSILTSDQLLVQQHFTSIMEEALLSLDAYLLNTEEGQRGDYNCVGCTACIVGVTEHFIFCANVGDSGAAVYTTDWIQPLSVPHRITSEKEQKRIQAAGYSVFQGRIEGLLAVPRALGDFDFKQCGGKSQREQAVCAIPDVTVRCVPTHGGTQSENSVEFCEWGIIIACDGVWDTLTNHQVHHALVNTENDLAVSNSVQIAVEVGVELMRERRRGPRQFASSITDGDVLDMEEGGSGGERAVLAKDTAFPPLGETLGSIISIPGGDGDPMSPSEYPTVSLDGAEGYVSRSFIDPALLTAASGIFAQCVAPMDNDEGIGLDNCSLIIIKNRR